MIRLRVAAACSARTDETYGRFSWSGLTDVTNSLYSRSNQLRDCRLNIGATQIGWLSPRPSYPHTDGQGDGAHGRGLRRAGARLHQDAYPRGLQVTNENGVKLGRPRSTPEDLVARIVRERTDGKTAYAIARNLNKDAVPTAQGARAWSQATVRALLMREGVH
jgi:hypothetical protein